MLKEFLRKGINFQRVQETLNAGTELVEQAHAEGIHSAPDVEQQMKKRFRILFLSTKKFIKHLHYGRSSKQS